MDFTFPAQGPIRSSGPWGEILHSLGPTSPANSHLSSPPTQGAGALGRPGTVRARNGAGPARIPDRLQARPAPRPSNYSPLLGLPCCVVLAVLGLALVHRAQECADRLDLLPCQLGTPRAHRPPPPQPHPVGGGEIRIVELIPIRFVSSGPACSICRCPSPPSPVHFPHGGAPPEGAAPSAPKNVRTPPRVHQFPRKDY
jgi:hypothetical protein